MNSLVRSVTAGERCCPLYASKNWRQSGSRRQWLRAACRTEINPCYQCTAARVVSCVRSTPSLSNQWLNKSAGEYINITRKGQRYWYSPVQKCQCTMHSPVDKPEDSRARFTRRSIGWWFTLTRLINMFVWRGQDRGGWGQVGAGGGGVSLDTSFSF